jgi:hypothetical protein
VTALNLDIGSRVWWPSRLAREARQDAGRIGEPEVARAIGD